MSLLPAKICMFHQHGHCKFGSLCRHFHTQHTCTNALCDKSTCTSRHPKHCRFYTKFSLCKFGTSCSFLHVDTAEGNDIEQLKTDLKHVLDLIKGKEIEMKALEDQVNMLESRMAGFKCDSCNSSKTMLPTPSTHKDSTHEGESPSVHIN